MRRLLAFSLLLFFNLPMVSPLFALATNSDANLPACCRRNGAHHCNMQMPQSASNDPAFASIPTKCPAYPRPATLVRITHAQAQGVASVFTIPSASASFAPRAQTRAKVAIKSLHHKRGPPTQETQG